MIYPKLLLLFPVWLFPGCVWNILPTHVHAFRGLRFESNVRRGTKLHPHRFNGGYDPTSPLTWTPHQAAEFTIFHEGTPQHAGMQLKPAISHWSGIDLAEYLTRLYLGQLTTVDQNYSYNTTKKVVYEPKNVRTPQWEGLDTREGILALKDLLKEALSKDSLSAQEISRFAEAFLLKEYRWPSIIQKSNSTSSGASISNSKSGNVVFEHDSFYSLGHAPTIARVLLAVRKERGYNGLNWNDIASMVVLPERRDEDRVEIPMKMIDFFRSISASIPLSTLDEANIVQRLAIAGWLPSTIPRFMTELIPARTRSENHYVDEIMRLQGDSFLDFPGGATVFETNSSKVNNSSAIELAIAKVARVVDKKSEKSPSKESKESIMKTNDVRSEYEDLVQSYWEKVEVKKSQQYGVPKTKSIKKRKVPKTFVVESPSSRCSSR